MSKRVKCGPTAHAFDKFDDATIYCRNCGEQRVMDLQAAIAALPQPIYYPCTRPHYPTWTPTWWGTTTAVPQPTITYGTVTVGNTASGIYPDTTMSVKAGA